MQLKKNYILYLSVIVYFLLPQKILAQPFHPQIIKIEKKLSLLLANSFNIFEDSRGFCWISTANGLIRWDGKNYTQFLHKDGDTTSLPDNYCINTIEDKNGAIWVGTLNGFAKYNEATASFRKIYGFVGFTNLQNCDSKNRLYIFNPNKSPEHFIYDIASNEIKNISNKLFERVFYYPSGPQNKPTLLLGMNDGFGIKIAKLNADTVEEVNTLFDGSNKKEPLLNFIHPETNFSIKSSNQIFLGSQNGLMMLDPATRLLSFYNTSNKQPIGAVTQIFRFNDELILQTKDGSVYYFNVETKILTKIQMPLQGTVFGVIDKSKILLKHNNTTCLIDMAPHFYHYINTRSPERAVDAAPITQVLPYSKSQLLIATDEQISLIDTTTGQLVSSRFIDLINKSIGTHKIRSIDATNGNEQLVVTTENEILRCNFSTLQIEDVSKLLPHNIQITQTAITPLGDIAVIAKNELFMLETTHDKYKVVKVDADDSISLDVSRIYYDSAKKYFILMAQYGNYWMCLKKEFNRWKIGQGLWINNIFIDLQNISANEMLLSTQKQPVIFDKSNFSVSPLAQFIKFNWKIEDGARIFKLNDSLWLSISSANYTLYNTNKLFRYDILNATDPVFQSAKIYTYLIGKESLLLSGESGLLSLSIKNLAAYAAPAHKIYFSSIILNDSTQIPLSFEANQQLTLPKENNTVTLKFSSINFASSSTIFETSVKGYDTNWIANTSGEIRYTNLAKGKYKIIVREKSNPLNEISFEVTILPKWYETLWFKALAVLALLAFGRFMYATKIKAIKATALAKQNEDALKILKSETDKRIAQAEMAALRSNMNPHFIFNCLNSVKLFIAENNNALAKDYLNKFSKLIRKTLDNSFREFVTLQDELETLKFYIEFEAIRFKNKLSYQINVDENIDSAFIEIPPLLIQPYIENAIWHGLMHREEGGWVHLDIMQPEQNSFQIIITDNGIGRAMAAVLKSKSVLGHKSHGTRVTGERIALIKEKYGIAADVVTTDLFDETGQPSGTQVVITLPSVLSS